MTTANQQKVDKPAAKSVTSKQVASAINTKLPTRINLDKWEDTGYSWSGQVTPEDLPRIKALVPEEHQNHPINLTVNLKREGQLLTLNLNFEGDVWAICQRCIQPLGTDTTHDTQLILLLNEEQKSLISETDDYILLDELLGEQEGRGNERFLPLLQLVEDELLLDLPMSAKHEDCEMAVEQVGVIIEEEAENPFAALEALKGKL